MFWFKRQQLYNYQGSGCYLPCNLLSINYCCLFVSCHAHVIMANASAKRLAASNAAYLRILHRNSAILYLIFIISMILRRKLPSYLSLVLIIPALIAEWMLDSWGRPYYRGGSLIRAGTDLEGPGIVQYLYDIIIVTRSCVGLSLVLGNKAWYLYLTVPAYTAFKFFSLLKAGLKLLRGAQSPATADGKENE